MTAGKFMTADQPNLDELSPLERAEAQDIRDQQARADYFDRVHAKVSAERQAAIEAAANANFWPTPELQAELTATMVSAERQAAMAKQTEDVVSYYGHRRFVDVETYGQLTVDADAIEQSNLSWNPASDPAPPAYVEGEPKLRDVLNAIYGPKTEVAVDEPTEAISPEQARTDYWAGLNARSKEIYHQAYEAHRAMQAPADEPVGTTLALREEARMRSAYLADYGSPHVGTVLARIEQAHKDRNAAETEVLKQILAEQKRRNDEADKAHLQKINDEVSPERELLKKMLLDEQKSVTLYVEPHNGLAEKPVIRIEDMQLADYRRAIANMKSRYGE